MNLPERIVAVHLALTEARVPHAFGGAIALAFCVGEARATADMDINVFVPVTDCPRVLTALPQDVEEEPDTVEVIARDGQVRLWWADTPVDLFFNTTPFHEAVAARARTDRFGPVDLPVLACRDLAVFKTFFDRPKDWVDLASMAEAGTLDVADVCGVLVDHLGVEDPRIARVRTLVQR